MTKTEEVWQKKTRNLTESLKIKLMKKTEKYWNSELGKLKQNQTNKR